jgi:large subunit ribosomal protein L31
MKKDIHPEAHETTITCTCGHVYHTRSTVKNLRIGICAACHPYFTGEQRFVDTAGRVDKFAKRYGATSTAARRGKPKVGVAAATAAATAAVAAASAETEA